MEDREIIQEFLLESAENLGKLDQDMVQLEREPGNRELLAGVFRTIHTIKGTCGFLGFSRLEALSHVTEDLLSELRNGARSLDAGMTTLILESVDAIRRILESIEAGDTEGPVFEKGLIARLKLARDETTETPEAAAAEPPKPVLEERYDGSVPGAAPMPAEDSSPARAAAVPDSTLRGASDTTLRVDVGLLDRLMNLVGELVLTRNQLTQYNSGHDDPALNAVSQRLNLITSELQEGVMKTRMQPIGVVWNKLPRVGRDLAAALHKQIALEMEGAETELDRTIIEAIKDPLTHIVRNSCDHGIETPEQRIARGKKPQGRLMLRAWHEGGQVNIEISDDGAGIDPARVKAKALERHLLTDEQAARLSERDAINLVFLPGFSTAAAVTSISGRGVGMDVVRTHIEKIGGAVDLTSRAGQGTTVRVRIPLTLAIIPGLVVMAGGERFVIPQGNLDELIQTGEGGQAIEYVHNSPVLRRRNALLPLADLCSVLAVAPQRRPGEASVVVLQADRHRFGLIVDSICDSQEIVVKPLGVQLQPLDCYAGATIMGDGRLALILDIAGLALRAGMIEPSRQDAKPLDGAVVRTGNGAARNLFLLCRGGAFQRLAIPLSRVARLEKIAASAVEYASNRPVIQYRGRILPLLNLGQSLDAGGGSAPGGDALHVVVFRSGPAEIGLVVDEITDILNEAIVDPQGSDRADLLGSAMIGGRVTDLLDLDSIAQSAIGSSPGSLERLAQALSPEKESQPREALV